jgi:anti-sigma factor RsiW
LLCLALLNLLVAIPRQVRGMATTRPSERRRFALVIAAYNGAMLLIVAAGTGLIAGFDGALFLLAAAVIALSLLAIANSWTLSLISSEPGGDS